MFIFLMPFNKKVFDCEEGVGGLRAAEYRQQAKRENQGD